MNRLKLVGAVVLLTSGAAAQDTTQPSGYLTPGAFDLKAVLPVAPQPGDARAKADRAIFRATRALANTERGKMASNDARLEPSDLARDFSCSVGMVLSKVNAPRTMELLSRAAADTAGQTNAVKEFYKRERPFKYDRGAICQPIADLHNTFDYPSGHTTLGWTWATILARLLPDRSTAILARGRAYGESRVVCGAHNWSAVEGGFISASATLNAVSTVSDFQSDLAAAKRELDNLRADQNVARPDGASCNREAMLVAQRIFP